MSLSISADESIFLKTNKTDAILVVDGMKLHVNKAILSYHSDYFNTLFNSEFKEKSMSEIEIKDVQFWEFAALLSLVHGSTVKPHYSYIENILELADRFLLPSVKPYLEGILIISSVSRLDKLRIAEKYNFKDLMSNGIQEFTKEDDIHRLVIDMDYNKLADSTKVRILTQMLFQKSLVDK
ncbi:hypothetical protein L5515_009611 [Caenorhabditis briggsae]|uniref:BTB domain-containing protein n=1 Tax=Caenorhabditis briggsae TaxID=6238 RepID=A0AAE9F4L1_CAEBR|nr:hypothetical protein L5515_009611 [Caenorhabditis briggsae]